MYNVRTWSTEKGKEKEETKLLSFLFILYSLHTYIHVKHISNFLVAIVSGGSIPETETEKENREGEGKRVC